MALRFHDGWDYMATAQLPGRWTSFAGATVGAAASGRNGGKALFFSGNADVITKVIDAQAEWYVGFAYQTSNVTTLTAGGILRFLDGGTLHFDLRLDALGRLLVTRNGTTLSTGTTGLVTNTWYYIEVYVKIGDAGVGLYQVKLNGVDEIHSAGSPVSGDTRNAGNATADTIRFNGATSHNNYIDDVYIGDGTSSFTFLGDCRAEALYPNGNGNSSVLVGSDGNSTDNYLLVDESGAPTTADYVESSTPGDKDTYAYTALTPTSGTVHAVTVLPYAAKTDAGTRSIVTVARVSTTEVDSAVLTLSNTNAYLNEVPRTTKPGGGAWSVSDVNGAEFGVKINA